MIRPLPSLILLPALLLAACATHPPTTPLPQTVGEQFPSDDPQILNFHPVTGLPAASLLYRSASPVRDIYRHAAFNPSILSSNSDAAAQFVDDRAKHLYALGIRTIISFENPTSGEDKASYIKLEQAAAEKAGITYLSCPMSNAGPNSFETLSPQAAQAQLENATQLILNAALKGPVLYHCSAGHDRTGIVTAYMRMKFEHWSVEKAIAEMRSFGHNFIRFSHNHGESSWHEDTLRALAPTLPVLPAKQ